MGVLPSVVPMLSSSNFKLVNPALRFIGNVLAGDDDQTQMCLDIGVLPYLEQLLNSSQFTVVKESLWCISNITAGNESQIQVRVGLEDDVQMVLNDDIIPWLVEIITTGKAELQHESCWVVCNAICGGSPAQIAQVMQVKGLVPAVCSVMSSSSEPKLQAIILDALDRCLTVCVRWADDV